MLGLRTSFFRYCEELSLARLVIEPVDACATDPSKRI